VIEGGNAATGYVWPGRDRVSPLHPTSLSHLIGRLGRAAGLIDPLGRHIAHLHGLRHTAGSMALANGVSLAVVQAQLRHSRADFTASTYLHLLGDSELDRFADAHRTRTPSERLERLQDRLAEHALADTPAER